MVPLHQHVLRIDETGGVTGRIMTREGDGIFGALGTEVSLNRRGTVVAAAVTSEDGQFRLENVGPGSYTFRSYSRHDVIKAIYDNMMGEIDRIHDELVTDEDLFVAKGALTDGAFQIRYLDGYATVRSLALEKLRFGNHSRSANYIGRVRAVTAEEVRDAARKYIRPERMQVVLVGEPIDLLD